MTRTSDSAQLEREADQARAQLAQTLDELRERITPGELVDQALDYARSSGGGDFVRNLGRQMADNPLPVCLMGAGLAWLMLSNRGAPAYGTAAAERVSRVAGETSDAAGDLAQRSRERIGETAEHVESGIGEAANSLGDAAASSYHAARTRVAENAGRAASAVAGSAGELRHGVADASRNLMQFCAEQPLILAGVGLALGAALGAGAPATEAEDRLMGESSDRVRDRAREVAQQQYAKGKAVAGAAIEAAHAESEKQGLRADEGDERKSAPSLVPAGDDYDDEPREPQAAEGQSAERPHGIE